LADPCRKKSKTKLAKEETKTS